MAQAFAGIGTVMGGGPDYTPTLVEWAFSDEVGAVNFYASIMDALYARSVTGEGQRVTTSQTAATIHFQRPMLIQSMRTGEQRNDGLALRWQRAENRAGTTYLSIQRQLVLPA